MGFKNFCNEQNNQTKQEQTQDEKVRVSSQNVEKLYNKYKDKSQDELIFELLKNVEKQKEEGSFNFIEINNMIEKITPFLTESQKIKMQELLNTIK